ncbi:hypothetical protein NUACC21_03860 [Scytonema sp. NUACC21]
MDAYNQRSISQAQTSYRQDDLRDTALGMVSTQSFPAIVGTADNMLKSAGVHLVGYEKIGGGQCTAIVRGAIADVRLAVETGVQVAEQFGQLVSSLVIPRPYPNLELVLPISKRFSVLAEDGKYSRLSNLAIGLVETRGFPAMVGADDDAFKALKVVLEGNLTARPQNVVVYATSNRRHLIREFFADRPSPKDNDEIHAWDTMQEKLSFSDRFGLTLTFEPANQKTYLQIVHHLALQAEINMTREDLEYRALQWATRHNGRSGRTARQFVDFLKADLALSSLKNHDIGT